MEAMTQVADPRKRVERLNSDDFPDLGYCVSATIKRIFNKRALEDADALELAMKKVASETEMTIVNSTKHQFKPHGASCVLLLSESHFACHTWPEHSMATLTVYTCTGPGQALAAVSAFMREMQTNMVKMVEFKH